MDFDDIDKQIIDILSKNGRESLTNLGETVKKNNDEPMSHAGIRKRLKKLVESEVLRVQAIYNPNTLGYKQAFILLEMKDFNEIKNLINFFSECPRVFLLSQTTGQYNLIIGVIGQNLDVINRFIDYCGPSNKEGILHSHVLFASNFKVPEYIPITLFSKISGEKKCGNICGGCEAFLDGNCDGCGNF